MFSYCVSVSNSTCVPSFADSEEMDLDALGKGWMQRSTGLVPH